MNRTFVASLGRIADFGSNPYAIEKMKPEAWESGDYVAGEVVGKSSDLYHVEDTTGAMHDVKAGDRIIGAFGTRAATLEGVGSWRDIRDGHMHAMTSAGLIGAFTSLSTLLPAPLALKYTGHVVRSGRKLKMQDFALQIPPPTIRQANRAPRRHLDVGGQDGNRHLCCCGPERTWTECHRRKTDRCGTLSRYPGFQSGRCKHNSGFCGRGSAIDNHRRKIVFAKQFDRCCLLSMSANRISWWLRQGHRRLNPTTAQPLLTSWAAISAARSFAPPTLTPRSVCRLRLTLYQT